MKRYYEVDPMTGELESTVYVGTGREIRSLLKNIYRKTGRYFIPYDEMDMTSMYCALIDVDIPTRVYAFDSNWIVKQLVKNALIMA